MIVHNFDPVLIDFGFIEIRWYSLSYIIGITLGWVYAAKIIKIYRNEKFFEKLNFDDFIIYLVLGIIFGGRLGYVIFYNLEYYLSQPIEIFEIWKGGMSFHGGLLGVIISIFIFSRVKNISFFILSDIVSCAAPIGLFLGRIANFINGELYGKISNLPWAIIFPQGGNVARHPSQIYEALLEGLILFLIVNFFSIKKRLILKNGFSSAIFLIFYSIFRIFSEIFREPDEHIGFIFGYFSMGTLLSFLTLLTGFLIIFFTKKNEQSN